MPRFDVTCIDVIDFLDCLNIRNVEKATEREVKFSCPYPAHLKGDESPSAYMNVETTKFFCHSCHAKGDAISFATDLLEVSPIAAIRMLKQRYSPGGIDPDSRCMVEEIRKLIEKVPEIRRENRILPQSVLDKYHVDWHVQLYDHGRYADPWAKYIHDRGFSIATLFNWEFGYSRRHRRITLPVRDENGCLVGIKARALDERKPKYLNLKDEENDIEPYLKNEIVFALDRVGSIPHLIIVEGELNAIAMHQMGLQNTVALNGSYFGDRQIQLIKRYAYSATLFFDSDQAGYDATHAVARELLPFMPVSIVPDHEGDPAVMHEYSIKRCINESKPYVEVMLQRA